MWVHGYMIYYPTLMSLEQGKLNMYQLGFDKNFADREKEVTEEIVIGVAEINHGRIDH